MTNVDLKAFKAQKQNAENELVSSLKENIVKAANLVLDKYPYITSLGWVQAEPYCSMDGEWEDFDIKTGILVGLGEGYEEALGIEEAYDCEYLSDEMAQCELDGALATRTVGWNTAHYLPNEKHDFPLDCPEGILANDVDNFNFLVREMFSENLFKLAFGHGLVVLDRTGLTVHPDRYIDIL